MSDNLELESFDSMFEDFSDLLELQKDNAYTFVAFVFFLPDKEKERIRFNRFMGLMRETKTFDDFVSKTCNTNVSRIDYIKTFSTKEEKYKNIVLFNPSLYNDRPKLTETEDIEIAIENEGERTKDIINFLSSPDCFINGFINKLNKKTKISTPRLRATMFKQAQATNVETLSNETEYISQVVTVGKKDFILKKKTKLRLVIDNEQILACAKLGFPNTVSVCLNDKSYLATNKVSVYCDTPCYESFKKKLTYIFELYKSIFDTDLTTEKKTIHVTLKRPNREGLINNPFLFTPPSNIVISDKFISFKYMTSLNSLSEKEALITSYYEKQKKTKEVFSNNVDVSSLMFMCQKNLTKITKLLPSPLFS